MQQTLEISHRVNLHVEHVDLELGESLQLVKQVQAFLMSLTLLHFHQQEMHQTLVIQQTREIF